MHFKLDVTAPTAGVRHGVIATLNALWGDEALSIIKSYFYLPSGISAQFFGHIALITYSD